MADSDLIKLYSGRILELAADMPLTQRLEVPDATARRRAPVCGSTVTVDLKIEAGKVTAFGQDVKACALGQASAAIAASHIIGLDRAAISQARDQLFAMLKEGAPPPTAPFDEMKVLEPARDYKNRHASIMLALDATLEAFDKAAEAA